MSESVTPQAQADTTDLDFDSSMDFEDWWDDLEPLESPGGPTIPGHLSDHFQGGVLDYQGSSTTWDESLNEPWSEAAPDDEETQGPVGASIMSCNDVHSSATEQAPVNELQLTCPHACTHKGSFKGRYELNRHILTKHGKIVLQCPYPGCFKKQKPTSFTRPDKLTAHIRASHRTTRNPSLQCPTNGCITEDMTIDILAVHIRQNHWTKYHGATTPLLQGIVNAGNTEYRECPLPLCHWTSGRAGSRNSFMQHLATHTLDELDGVADRLSAANYRVLRTSQTHNLYDAATSTNSSGCTTTSSRVQVQALCPFPNCQTSFENHETLENHIDCSHLIDSKHTEHFIEHQTAVKAEIFSGQYQAYGALSKKLRPYVARTLSRHPQCAFCGAPLRYGYNHHLGMVADPKSIKPYRSEILRLYPDFAHHPIWEDLKF